MENFGVHMTLQLKTSLVFWINLARFFFLNRQISTEFIDFYFNNILFCSTISTLLLRLLNDSHNKQLKNLHSVCPNWQFRLFLLFEKKIISNPYLCVSKIKTLLDSPKRMARTPIKINFLLKSIFLG